MITWKPLSIPKGATPEEAFLKAGQASSGSEGVILVWHRERGWGGCFASAPRPGEEDSRLPVLLTTVGEWAVIATVIKETFSVGNSVSH